MLRTNTHFFQELVPLFVICYDSTWSANTVSEIIGLISVALIFKGVLWQKLPSNIASLKDEVRIPVLEKLEDLLV
jgi:hypothetical protein